jgi:hypothetical protein
MRPPTLPELLSGQEMIDLRQPAKHSSDADHSGIWRQPVYIGNREDRLPPGKSVPDLPGCPDSESDDYPNRHHLRAPEYGTDESMRPLSVEHAGLNSTPELTWTFILVICLQALKVSYKHSTIQRDKKGAVSRMRSMAVSVGSRSAAALAVTFSALAAHVTLSGESG